MSASQALADATVLVVDDDEDIREMIALHLGRAGYTSVQAASGHEALARLRGGLRPILILLDVMMPRMNGRQFCAALAAEPALGTPPVVIISGDTQVERKARDLGAVGQLHKPFNATDLLETVARYRVPSPPGVP
jgi:CheY-like chemotaxis protein